MIAVLLQEDHHVLKENALLIGKRMDRLPVTRFTWGVVILGSLAWFIESLSIGAMGVVLPVLKKVMTLTTSDVGVLAVASTFGIVVGLIPAGRLSDLYGRKTILVWGIVEYSVLTMLCAFSPNYLVLVFLRFLSGLGMGAVFPLPYAIIGEFVPRNRRSTFNGFMDAALSTGYFIAPLLGLLILPRLAPTVSWRVFFVVSGLPLLSAWFINRYLPESPRWLSRRGYVDRANTTMAAIEHKVQLYFGKPLPEVESIDPTAYMVSGKRAAFYAPWLPEYVVRTLVNSVAGIGAWFMFYIVMIYLPYIFSKEGFTLAHALLFTAIITGAAIPGKILNGYFGELLGRKIIYVVFMGVAGLGAFFFGGANTPTLMILFGCTMSFFGTGVFPSFKMSYAEQYPTPIRTTGSATIETVGRFVGGVIGSYAFPAMIIGLGLIYSFDLVGIVALIGVASILFFGDESNKQSLEALEVRDKVDPLTNLGDIDSIEG